MYRKFWQTLFSIVLLAGMLLSFVQPNQAQASAPQAAADQTTANKIEERLSKQLEVNGSADFIVRFAEQADLSPAYNLGWKERGWFVYNTLTEVANRSQAKAKGILAAYGLSYQTFIAGNELYVWAGDLQVAQTLADLPEVASIRAPRTYYVQPITVQNPVLVATWAGDLLAQSLAATVGGPALPEALAWGIDYVNADDFWSTFGLQGDGIVVANIDTGVQWNHPALDQSFKCGANPSDPACWADPSNICGGSACDNAGHGTHTMGTMVADDDSTLPWQAGMAPNAEWIACKGCESWSCSEFALNSCADWILAPAGNPDNRPHVVNNSWGGGGGDPWYQAKVQAWVAAGTFPAFSAGNSGSGCSTLGSPGDYQESFASAAIDSNGDAAGFSSRGPSAFGHDPYTKPNIAAPGVNVCSTVPGDGWDCTYSGTSMASPHSAGAVALLWSCNPSLIGQIYPTFEALQDSAGAPPAGNCGAPPDNEGNYTYGYGYLDIYAAGLLWCGSTGTLAGTVTDASTNDPIEGATVAAGMSDVETEADGTYQMPLLVGTYTVTASAFGYLPSVAAGVVIVTDTVTTQDFALTPAQMYNVYGYVTDANTGWPLYASIDIAGYPGGTIWTNPVNGYYSVELPEGMAFNFTVQAFVPGYLPQTTTVGPLTSDTQQDFALDADLASCTAPGYEANSALLVTEDFDAGIPATWDVVNNGGDCVWRDDDPGFRGNNTGGSGPFAVADSDYCGWGSYMDTELQSPVFDATGYDALWIEFKTDYIPLGDIADVDVFDGADWQNALTLPAGGVPGPATLVAATTDGVGAANAQIRFHYYEAYWAWWWSVDDVRVYGVTCTPPASGGLVVGNVYDANTLDPLNNAQVANDVGDVVSTVETPDDPTVDDGFYTIYSLEGTHTFTATMSGNYAPDIANVYVTDGGAVKQDFYLPTAITFTPAPVHVTLDWQTTDNIQATVSSLLPWDYDFVFKEIPGGFIPVLQGGTGEWLYRAEQGVMMAVNGGGQALAYPSAYRWTPAYPSALNILVYADDPYHPSPNTYLDQALQALGLGYTAYYDGNWSGFVSALTSGTWDLVLVANDNFADPSAFTPLNNYVLGGGKLILHSWALGWDDTNPLWTTLGIAAYAEDYEPPDPVYWWDPAHLFFNSPNAVPEFTSLTGSLYGVYGQHVEPLPGFEALAGYTTPGPDPNEAALILGNDDRTVFRGFLDGQNNADLDSDGMLDGVELWINLINGVAFGISGEVPWLAEEPITNTVPANGTLDVTLYFSATLDAGVNQPGDYYAKLKLDGDPQLTVQVTMTVLPSEDMGKLQGTVLDNCTGGPVEATITIVDGDPITQTFADQNGYYSAWLFSGDYDLIFSADGYLSANGSATIVAGETTTVDAILIPDRGCIATEPEVLEVWVLTGTEVYTHFTGLDIFNPGGADLTFELREAEGGYAPMKISIPPFTGSIPPSDVPPSVGRNPNAPLVGGSAPEGIIILGAQAYGQDAWPSGDLITFDADDPSVLTHIGNVFDPFVDFVAGGDFLFGDFSTLYGLTFYGNQFIAIDTATAAVTVIGPAAPTTGNWTGMAISLDGTIYAGSSTCSASTLYTIDPDTGAPTVVGPVTNAPCLINLAVTPDGTLYGVDIINDVLLSIDPDTGAGTVIGSIGFDANYAQSMDYEEEAGVMYMAAYSSSGELRIVDLTTGNTSLVGSFPGGEEIEALAFATGGTPVDVPWFWEEPVTGTVPAGDVANVGIYFTALYTDATPMPLGTYTATLRVRSNDTVAGTQSIPVIMHIVDEYITPTLSFESNSPVLEGETMVFTNTSDPGIPPVLEFVWDFGDGFTMTADIDDPISHTYADAGIYTVTLSGCNVLGCYTFSAQVVVEAIITPIYLPTILKN